MSTKCYRIFCLSEAIAPITHMSGSAGNESVVMREPVVTDKGVVWIPCLTGNALRHRCVREPGWRYLIDRYELSGKLTLPQLNYAFHGGNLTEGGGRENLRLIADVQRIFPLSRLVGGCLPDQILSGSLDVWRGRLACEENRMGLATDLPSGWELPDEPLRSAEHFVSGYQYTRGDAQKTVSELLPTNGDGELLRGEDRAGKSNLMIFSGQSVIQGACFLHGFLLKHVDQLAFGALLWSLKLWQDAGGTIGGQAARGHGRLALMVHTGEDDQAAIDAYLTHVDSVKDDAIAWMNEAFAARPKKEKKPKAEAAT